MKSRFLTLAACVLCASPALAQLKPPIPQTEVYVGGSYYRAGISNGTNLYGWQTEFDYNLSKHAGVVLDLGGQYKKTSGITIANYQYLIGPQLKRRAGSWTMFIHGLAGGNAVHVPGATRGAFAVGGGGGLDRSIGRIASIRVIQVDSLHDHFGGVWTHNLRVSAGIVFKFGRP
ncbi:MAG: hypothetical protein ACM3NO_00325 [Deltaproteobacteria bacterium]